MGEIAKDVGAKFIHISTDYVFPGTGEQPLTEKDQTGPLSYYGVTKLEGENRALDLGALVIRTSWVFGGKGKNFVSKLLIMLQTHEEVYLTDDQWGRFTYAFDLAKTILKVLNKNGLYQFANGGVATRYEFGIRMREEALLLGYPVLTESLIPVPGATFKAPTARPRYSAFDTTKIESLIQIRHWQDTIKDFLCAQIAACS